MGYLDDIRKKSSEKRKRDADEAKRWEALTKRYLEVTHPKMTQIFSHLSELIEHFQVVKPVISIGYQLTASGTVVALVQQDHKVVTDSRDEMKEIIFKYLCVAGEKIKYSVENKKNIDKHIEYLQRYNLKFDSRLQRNDNHQVTHANIQVEPVVAVTVLITGDIETGTINFKFNNVESLGGREHTFQTEQVTDEIIDNLIKYIARDTEHFMQLDISDAAKRKLQHKLKLEKMRSEHEMRVAEKRYEEEQDTSKKK